MQQVGLSTWQECERIMGCEGRTRVWINYCMYGERMGGGAMVNKSYNRRFKVKLQQNGR